MRCKTLADELRQRGADVRFVCREQPGHLIGLLSDAGYSVFGLPAAVDVDQPIDAHQTIAALDGFQPDWLIVDHYGLDETWESRIQPRVGRLCVIDDLANRRHVCDLLIDQNWFGNKTTQRYQGLVPDRCVRLLGPEYALLQPLFGQLRATLPLRGGLIQRVLVFFGGVDSHHLTVRVLEALQSPEFVDLAVDVVVGHANSDASQIERMVAARPGAALHGNLPSLAGLMARADVMVGAGGVTTWERCCLGLPAIVAITAQNQKGFTTAVTAIGAQYSLGDAAALSADDFQAALREFRRSPASVSRYSAMARQLTDGLGVHRVAAVIDPPRIPPRLRQGPREDKSRTSGRLALIAEDAHGLPLGEICVTRRDQDDVVRIDGDADGLQWWSARALRSVMDLLRPEATFLRAETQAGEEPLRVTLLSDQDSWLNESLQHLVFEWFTKGHAVRWIHRPDELVAGDVCFLLGCGTILDAGQIDRHRHTLVVHESALPRGRGWSPLTWQVLEGAAQIPVTLLAATVRVDAGPIHRQTWITLDGTELLDELRAQQAEATTRLCREWIDGYPAVLTDARPQAGPATTYRRRTPKDSELDTTKPLAEQFPLLRVVDNERYPAFFYLHGERYVLGITKDKHTQ